MSMNEMNSCVHPVVLLSEENTWTFQGGTERPERVTEHQQHYVVHLKYVVVIIVIPGYSVHWRASGLRSVHESANQLSLDNIPLTSGYFQRL